MSDDPGQAIHGLVEEYDEKAIITEIALRAAAMSKTAAVASELNPEVQEDAEHLGIKEDVLELGGRIFRRVERELHEVICGNSAEDKKDRDSILKATGLGDIALGTALYTALTASLGMAPAVATVVAALLIKRIFQPAGAEFCKFWGDKITKRS